MRPWITHLLGSMYLEENDRKPYNISDCLHMESTRLLAHTFQYFYLDNLMIKGSVTWQKYLEAVHI